MTEFIQTTVDLIRHGEPEGGVKFRGSLDDPLSESGWQQMDKVLTPAPDWDLVVSSPLQRCSAFAEAFASQRNIECEVEPCFRELGFGQWEGLTIDEVTGSDFRTLSNFWRDPINNTPPGAESLEFFRDRVLVGWRALLERHAGKHLLLVVHGAVIRVMLHDVLQVPLNHVFRLEVAFACLSRVRIDGLGSDAVPNLVFHGGSLDKA